MFFLCTLATNNANTAFHMPRYLQIWARKGKIRTYISTVPWVFLIAASSSPPKPRTVRYVWRFFSFHESIADPSGVCWMRPIPPSSRWYTGRYAICYAIHGCCCSIGRFSFLFYLFFLALQLLLLIFQKHIVN